MREKICEALRICLHNNYDRVVIGAFGLGETYRNPPQAVAEIWRDLLLFHPDLCGQIESVDFAFVDQMQSTTQVIRDGIRDVRQKIHEGRRARHEVEEGTTSRSTRQTDSSQLAPTDMAIFKSVFDKIEIERVLEQAALIALIDRHLLPSQETL
ncbi:hypothetical protein E4U52_007782 [Claviceps spartinae]|nr:hypothetical protein E4U52_007782 [Claviceps spartinae]